VMKMNYRWVTDESLRISGWSSETTIALMEKVSQWNGGSPVVLLSRTRGYNFVKGIKKYEFDIEKPPYWVESLFDKDKIYVLPKDKNIKRPVGAIIEDGDHSWS